MSGSGSGRLDKAPVGGASVGGASQDGGSVDDVRAEATSIDRATVAVAAVVALLLAACAHVGGHTLVLGLLGTASYAFPLATDVGQHVPGLRDAWYVIVGSGGLAGQFALGFVAWRVLGRSERRPGAGALLAWLTFVASSWTAAAYLVASPLAGLGDVAVVVALLPNEGPARASASVTGIFICGLLWGWTVQSLSRLVGNGPAAQRGRRARRLVVTAWLAAAGAAALVAALCVAAAGLSIDGAGLSAGGVGSSAGGTGSSVGGGGTGSVNPPSGEGTSWMTAVTVGAAAAAGTLASLWPILPAAFKVPANPVPGTALHVPRSPLRLASGALAALALALILMRHLRLAP